MSEKEQIQFWRFGDWTMVYVNGELKRAGDHHYADEWLQDHFGVVVIDDEAGHCIPDGRNPITTLAEVQASMDAAKERAARAEILRARAAEILAEANRIEKGA